MEDNDVGEMFQNFILHKRVQALCGVHLTASISLRVSLKVPKYCGRDGGGIQ